MTARVLTYLKNNVLAILALTVALGTGGAYAANTIRSSDIVDGEVGSADVKDNSLNTFDVHSFIGEDVIDGTLTGADIANESIGVGDIGSQQVGSDEVVNDSLLQSDIRAGAITNDEVLDGSLIGLDVADDTLTGADINESTLASTATATFAGPPGNPTYGSSMTKMTGKSVPGGSYAVIGTANLNLSSPFDSDSTSSTSCELRNGGVFIGGALDRHTNLEDTSNSVSLTMNGGAQVPGAGGEISLWCRGDGGGQWGYGQIMMIRLGGFF
jgi:hypothetical protein